MNPGDKEVEWGLVESSFFNQMLKRSAEIAKLRTQEVAFHDFDLKIKVVYDDPAYQNLLIEKFYVTDSLHFQTDSQMHFVRHRYDHKVQLPFRNYGFVNEENQRETIVFAPSFGVFKSVISGFASFCYEGEGYYPVHGSVLQVNGHGVLFIGGSMAGKTTTLINIAHDMLKRGKVVQVLGDDWSVVKWQASGDLVAETFDPSVSLRKRNLEENLNVTFACQDWLFEQFATREKLSLPPYILYGNESTTNAVKIDRIVLLRPHPGPCSLRKEESDEEVARQIVHDAYHYPYVTEDQKDRHAAFWCDVQKRIEILCFNTRPDEGGRQSLAPIEEMLT